MIFFIPPVNFKITSSQIRNTSSVGIRGINLFLGGFALLIFFSILSSCKGGDKNTAENAKADFTAAVTESDSLFSQLYTVQQSFHQLKTKMADAPEQVRQQPEFQSLQERLNGAIIKSGVFFDEIDVTKAAAQAELKKLIDTGGTVAAVDSQMTVIRQFVERNQETLQTFRKASEMLSADYEKLVSGN